MELIPIFFGCLFFIACLIAGIIHGLKTRGKSRWIGLLIAGVGLIGLFPILVVAPPLSMTASSLSGTYQGDFGNYEMTLKLHKDGSFDQKVADDSGKVKSSHGTWEFDQIQAGSIDFDHILLPPMSPMDRTPGLTLGSFSGATVHSLDGGIYFNEDTDTCVKPVSNKG